MGDGTFPKFKLSTGALFFAAVFFAVFFMFFIRPAPKDVDAAATPQ